MSESTQVILPVTAGETSLPSSSTSPPASPDSSSSSSSSVYEDAIPSSSQQQQQQHHSHVRASGQIETPTARSTKNEKPNSKSKSQAAAQASHPSGSRAGDTPGDPVKRKIACMACRTIKLKCLLASPDAGPEEPCKRCAKMKLVCEYKPKRRPVKAVREGGVAGSARTVSVDEGSLTMQAHAQSPIEQQKQQQQQQHPFISDTTNQLPSSGNMAFDFRRSLSQSYPNNSNHPSDPSTTRDPTVFMNPVNANARVNDVFPRTQLPYTEGFPYRPHFPPHISDPSLDLAISPRTSLFLASTNKPLSASSPHKTTPAPSTTLSSYVPSLEQFQSSERSTIHRPPRIDSMQEDPSPATQTGSEISTSAAGHPSSTRDYQSNRSHERDDTVHSRTRYPMALTSVLDLIRRDLSDPPPPPKRRHTPDDIGGGSSSGVGGGGAGAGGTDPRQDHSDHLRDGQDRAPYRIQSISDHRDSFQSQNQRPPVWNATVDEEEGRPPAKRTRWEDERDDEGRHTKTTFEANDHRMESAGIPASPRERVDDPVSLGIIGPEEEAFLYKRYFETLNAYIAILDPVLHTPSYIFNTSPILYAAVLTATAHCFLPERYQSLLAYARGMMGKAFANGDADIGLCQALSLLSVWKDVGDKGSWLRVGYAIRVGYEIGLHARPRRPLPQDETEAREELNRERVWWQLTAFDRTMSHLHGRRQRMITPESTKTIVDYLTDHPHIYCPSDAMLATSLTSGDILEMLVQPYSFHNDNVGWKILLHRLKQDHRIWQEQWLSNSPPLPLHPLSRIIIGFYTSVVDFEMAEFERKALPNNESARILATSSEKAIDLLRYIIHHLAPAEVLRFAPDVFTIRGAKAGVFLARNMNRFDHTVVSEITDVFRQLIQVCRSASQEDHDTAYYQARFFTSLLRVSSRAPTRQPSRAVSPNANSMNPIPAHALLSDFDINRLIGVSNGINTEPSHLTIDELLQESQDWFSVDLMAHMNDPFYLQPTVITLPTTFIANS